MDQYNIYLFVLLFATLGDLLIPIIIALKYPGYDHFIDTISALGTKISPVQKYQCWNLILVGILFIVFAIGQSLAFEQIKWSHTLYILGIILFGSGTIIAGFFPEDPRGTNETASGKIHGIASGIGFMFLILNPLWALWIDGLMDLRIVNLIFLIFAASSFTLFLLSEKKKTGFLKYTGLFQRINLIILYGNIIMNYIWLNTMNN
ncbi:DUF998 domain-containing protein [bacterium]|nr:DUF998 domain-containing protein [bacterium]